MGKRGRPRIAGEGGGHVTIRLDASAKEKGETLRKLWGCKTASEAIRRAIYNEAKPNKSQELPLRPDLRIELGNGKIFILQLLRAGDVATGLLPQQEESLRGLGITAAKLHPRFLIIPGAPLKTLAQLRGRQLLALTSRPGLGVAKGILSISSDLVPRFETGKGECFDIEDWSPLIVLGILAGTGRVVSKVRNRNPV